jgi:hypothetical protein
MTPTHRPATPDDVAAIIARLKRLTRLGEPLRRDPGIREVFYELGCGIATDQRASPDRVERSLREHLRILQA